MLLFRVRLGTIPWDVPSILHQTPGDSSAREALATLAFWSNGRGSYMYLTFSETCGRLFARVLKAARALGNTYRNPQAGE